MGLFVGWFGHDMEKIWSIDNAASAAVDRCFWLAPTGGPMTTPLRLPHDDPRPPPRVPWCLDPHPARASQAEA